MEFVSRLVPFINRQLQSNCPQSHRAAPARKRCLPIYLSINRSGLSALYGKLITAAGLFLLSLPAAALQQAPLTTAAQVHHLPVPLTRQHVPVLLHGVVTQSIPEWSGFSMQDGTDAVYIGGSPVHGLNLRPGQRVEVQGEAVPGNFAPSVEAKQVKILGFGPLPKPVPADWKLLSSGACDNTYVQVSGVVRSVVPVEPPRWRWPATGIHIDVGGNVLWAYVRNLGQLALDQLPDAGVRLSGTCVVLSNSRKHFEGTVLLVSDAAKEVEIVEPSTQAPEALPITGIDRMFVYRPDSSLQRRVRIRGTVAWADENRVFVQDGSNGVLVRTVVSAKVRTGEVVDAIGYPTAGAYSAEMDDAILRPDGTHASVAPLDIKASDLIARFHQAKPFLPDSLLIRVDATVLGVSRSTRGEIFTLQDGPTVFSARLLNTEDLNPAIGTRVAVTGICVIQPDDLGVPQTFELLMRSPQDVAVLQPPSWLTRSLALRMAGALLGLVFIAVVCLVLLSHRVGRQSNVIKDQKRREQELGKRVQELVENANDLVYILDPQGHVLHVNYGAARLTGYGRQELLNLNMTDLLAPEERELFCQKLTGRAAQGASNFEQSEWTFLRKDGTRVSVELNQRFVAGARGEIRVEAIGRDVTVRKQAMFENEERFRTLADNIAQLAWMADESGSIVWYNERWFQYTGASLQEARGWGWQKWHHPEHVERVSARMRQSFENGDEWVDTFPLRGRDGQFRWFLGRAMPIFDPSGKVVRWFGTHTDITDQKQAQAELQRSNEDLQQFAYIASHDLQEPLRNVCIYTQMLARSFINGDLTPQRATYIDIVTSGAKRMEALISDLLTYSRATSTTPFEFPETSLTAVVQAAIENLRSAIDESHAVIRYGEMPEVRASPTHLVQVMQNLLANAIKYRRPDVPPEIAIRAERQVDRWAFSVEDNGSGFEPQYAEKVFGIFKRLHGNEIPGTGIGLAICKAIVERHGGKIWAEGRPGAGATFWFTLPAS